MPDRRIPSFGLPLFVVALLLASCTALHGMRVFIGCYTNDARSSGIYSLTLDEATGRLGTPELAAKAVNPTFLALSPDGTTLFSTAEIADASGKLRTAGLRSYRVLPDSPRLEEISAQPVTALGTSTHVVVAPEGRAVFSVHYNAAWVASLPVDASGALAPAASLLFHAGKTGPRSARQDKPHPHSVALSPDGRHAYVCDLGLDLVRTYRIDPVSKALTRLSDVAAHPGAGPRHARCTPDGRFVYVVNELDGTMTAHARNPEDGSLSAFQTLSLLPDGFAGENTSAEIQLHPDGRHVYASSRGPDLLTVLERSPDDGRLAVVQRISSGGRHPRHFALSPDGAWLVCANRDTDSLVVFAVDRASGQLRPTGFSAIVPQAVCVLFSP